MHTRWPRQLIVRLAGLAVVVTVVTAIPARVMSTASDGGLGNEIGLELNAVRTANHLEPILTDQRLVAVAQAKAATLATEHRFDHTTADGRPPWAFLQAAGYAYELAGENLAMDFSDSATITQAWLASPPHRQNLLDPAFTDVGIATAEGVVNGHQTTIVVALFGRPDARSVAERILTTVVDRLLSVSSQ